MRGWVKLDRGLLDFIDGEIDNISENHINAWQNRYISKDLEDIEFDLRVNHDLSIEIEIVEEALGRCLTSDEYSYFEDKFIKAVLRNISK